MEIDGRQFCQRSDACPGRGGSEQSNDDNRQWHPIHIYKSIDIMIVFGNGMICLYAQTTQMKQHTPLIELAIFLHSHVQERTDRLQENEYGKRDRLILSLVIDQVEHIHRALRAERSRATPIPRPSPHDELNCALELLHCFVAGKQRPEYAP